MYQCALPGFLLGFEYITNLFVIMKQSINPLVIICLPFFLIAQGNIKEFEGVINYQHQVVAKEPSYNVEYDYSAIGKYSEYYYKNGNYRFVNHNSYIEGDLFKAQEGKVTASED